MMGELRKTPLHALHVSLGARMVPFAGYDMPVQYPTGILKEHLHTRAAAGLFDVSHMGQIVLRPRSGRSPDAAAALERLVPMDVAGPGRGAAALRPPHQRRRRHPRRSDVRQPRRPAAAGGERRRQGRRTSRISRPGSAAAARSSRWSAGCWRCRGRRRRRCWRGCTRTSPACASWTCARSISAACRRWCRARATPARTASRSRWRRGTRADLAGPAAGGAGGAAGRARGARFAAARGRALPLRPRHRRRHHAGRGGARMGDPAGAAPRRRAGGRLSRART